MNESSVLTDSLGGSPAGNNFITFRLVLRTLGLVFAYYVAYFFYRLYTVRSLVKRQAREYGLDLLPHSWIMGHLIEVGKLLAENPPQTSGMYVPLLFARKYPDKFKDGVVYLDNWPFAPPMLAVFNADMMAQFTQEHSLPKHEMMHYEFRPFTQLNDLVLQEGQVWKMWRSIFNPGFSSKNLMSFVPDVIEEVDVFKQWLRKIAKTGEVTQMVHPSMKLTIDVIGRVTLNQKLNIQTTDSPFFSSFRKILTWLITDLSPQNMLTVINPLRYPSLWYHNWVIRKYLEPPIKQAIEGKGTTTGQKTVVNLAAKTYVQEADSKSTTVDSHFLNIAISQLKMFIFAGHDTTAITLAYAYHLLNTNPATLQKIRAEYDAVFGEDLTQVSEVIREKPHLLNALPYTSAVIKETLRLYPPAGTVRQGAASFHLTHPGSGKKYPTEGWMVFGNSMASHRWEPNCPDPDTFQPERWLAPEPAIVKNAFRPFELGARNCIGQELAQMELRIILALTLREFEFESAYEKGGPQLFGDLGYQILLPGMLTGRPKDDMPMRVRVRNEKSG